MAGWGARCSGKGGGDQAPRGMWPPPPPKETPVVDEQVLCVSLDLDGLGVYCVLGMEEVL